MELHIYSTIRHHYFKRDEYFFTPEAGALQ